MENSSVRGLSSGSGMTSSLSCVSTSLGLEATSIERLWGKFRENSRKYVYRKLAGFLTDKS